MLKFRVKVNISFTTKKRNAEWKCLTLRQKIKKLLLCIVKTIPCVLRYRIKSAEIIEVLKWLSI